MESKGGTKGEKKAMATSLKLQVRLKKEQGPLHQCHSKAGRERGESFPRHKVTSDSVVVPK